MNQLELQKNAFSQLGLSYDNGLRRFNEIYSKILSKIFKGIPTSQHQILFSSISFKNEIKTILEIGTFNGTNAKFLSALFPEANIITLDLEDSDDLFIKSYDRQDSEKRESFVRSRNFVLSTCRNVQFIQKNSVYYLQYETKKFDLIWVDGAHGYPFVTIDITNSLKLLNRGGFLICDDVLKEKNESDSFYNSIASMQTLIAFVNAKVISEFNLILKRFNNEKKYIAIVKEKNIFNPNLSVGQSP